MEHGYRKTESAPMYIYSDIDQCIDKDDRIHATTTVNVTPLYYGDLYPCNSLMVLSMSPEAAGVRLCANPDNWITLGWLKAFVFHDSLDTIPAALVVAMQFGDRFWFYPSWTEEFHAHPIEMLPARYGAEYTILDHEFTTDTEFHLTFWAALMTPDLSRIIGGEDGIDSIDITCSPW